MTKEEPKNWNYVCQDPKLLYVDRYGHIYPDCKTYISPVICEITDADAAEKVIDYVFKEDDLRLFNMVTVEFNSSCHAKCFYCFQEDGHRSSHYEYFDYLLPFLKKLNIKWLFFSGGEILDQPRSIEFIQKARKELPDTWIHLKTNGNALLTKVNFINECCDSIMVSFNGFSEATCQTIMQVELQKTIDFCDAVKKAGKCNLGVKFLASPITLTEVPSFLEWALTLEAKSIAVQTVYNYSFTCGKCSREEATFYGHNDEYWKMVYSRVGERLTEVINNHSLHLNCGYNHLTSDKKFLKLFTLPESVKGAFRTDGVYVIE